MCVSSSKPKSKKKTSMGFVSLNQIRNCGEFRQITWRFLEMQTYCRAGLGNLFTMTGRVNCALSLPGRKNQLV